MTAKPKPVKAGDAIAWAQYSQSGAGWVAAYTRTGIVWSGASIERGVSNAWWVSPDVPEPGDAYHTVYVGNARTRDYHRTEGPAKGQTYSSREIQDVTSIMTVSAWRAAQEIKRTKAARTAYATAA
jgi:hypothetical protein